MPINLTHVNIIVIRFVLFLGVMMKLRIAMCAYLLVLLVILLLFM